MKKPSIYATAEAQKAYWDWWLTEQKSLIDGKDKEDVDLITRSMIDLIEVAVNNEQYKFSDKEFEDVKRVVQIHIDLPRELIEKYFNVKTYSVYGVGLFTVVDGLVLSQSTREEIRYDDWKNESHLKYGTKLDLSSIPEELRKTHCFGLMTPALTGLFVPKNSPMLEWTRASWAIQYFDLVV